MPKRMKVDCHPGQYNSLFKTTSISEILKAIKNYNNNIEHWLPLSKIDKKDRWKVSGHGTAPEEKRI